MQSSNVMCEQCDQLAEVLFKADTLVPVCFRHLLMTCAECGEKEFRVMNLREEEEEICAPRSATDTVEQLVRSIATVEDYIYARFVQPEPAKFPDSAQLHLLDFSVLSHFPHKSDFRTNSISAQDERQSATSHKSFQEHCKKLASGLLHSKELESSFRLFPNKALEVIPVPNFNWVEVGKEELLAKYTIGRLISVRTGVHVYKMLRALYVANEHPQWIIEAIKRAVACAFLQYERFDTREFIYIHRDTSRPVTIDSLICRPLKDLWKEAFSHLGEHNPELTVFALIFILAFLQSDKEISSKESVQQSLQGFEDTVTAMKEGALVSCAFWLLGRCWSALDSFPQAETCFRKALSALRGRGLTRKDFNKENYGQVATVLHSLGALYIHMKRDVQASKCYDRALGIYASFPSSLFNRPASNAFYYLTQLYSRLSQNDTRLKVTISVLEKNKSWFTDPELHYIHKSLTEDLSSEFRSEAFDSSTEGSVSTGIRQACILHEQGKALNHQKKDKEAAVYLSAAVDLLMDSEYSSGQAALMWNDFSVLNLRIGRIEDAENGFNFAIGFLLNTDETHSDLLISIYMNLGRLYSLQNRHQDTINVYRTAQVLASHSFPNSETMARIHHQLGISYHRSGALPSGKEQFERAVQIYQLMKPESPEKALVLCGLGTINEELKIWNEAQNAYIDAEQIYTKLNPRGKELASVCNKLGRICAGGNRLDTSIKYYRKAVQVLEYSAETSFDQAAILSNLGLVHARRKSIKDAVECYQQSIALYASSYTAIVPLLRLGEVYTSTNQLKEAETCFKNVVELLESTTQGSDFEANAYVTVAKFYKKLKRDSDSEVNLQKAVVLYERLDGNSTACAKARIDLGLLVLQMGRNGQAEYHFTRALESLNSTDPDSDQVALVWSYLGDVYKAGKKLLEAENAYARAIKRFKVTAPGAERTGRLYGQIAWVYKELALYEQAEFAFKRSIEILESGPNPKAVLPICNNLGHLYRAQGRLEEAKEVFSRGVALLDPEESGDLGVSLRRNLSRLT